MRFLTGLVSAVFLAGLAASPVLAHGTGYRCWHKPHQHFWTDGHGKRHRCPAKPPRHGKTDGHGK